MSKLFTSAKINLLSRFSVPHARKYLQTITPINPLPEVEGTQKQLLVDVSVIIKNDRRTGIQRVVRSILLQLLAHPPAGYCVRPVFASRQHGYHYAPNDFCSQDMQTPDLNQSTAVNVKAGDVFLGLDLAAHLLPLHKAQLTHWKQLGIKIHIVVYDLLPVLYPQWFNPKTSKNFHRWLKTIAIFADSLLCISNTVKADLDNWLTQKYSLARGSISLGAFKLGADIEASAPSHGLPVNSNDLITSISGKPSVLMVGTLEPRKGHSQVLTAFEKLWQQGDDINLVIVGRPGWKTEELQQRLRSHQHIGNHLYWFDNASDEFLELIYQSCAGVILASYAEGFGLPLIEARHYNKPVLARDIPVLREVGGSSVTFFSDNSSESLKSDIELWLARIAIQQLPNSQPQHTWQNCADELLNFLSIAQSNIQQNAVHLNRAMA